jgi:hypothetical protein
MDLYNNNKNEKLKFKLNVEGIDTRDFEPRLIFNSSDKINCVIYGEIKENICYFDIPELSIYQKDDQGKMKFELVSEELYFNVWNDKFNIKTKSTIKIDEMIREISNPTKPQIKAVLDADLIVESKEEVKEVKEEVEKSIELIKEEHKPEIKKQKINEKSELLSFENFFKK